MTPELLDERTPTSPHTDWCPELDMLVRALQVEVRSVLDGSYATEFAAVVEG